MIRLFLGKRERLRREAADWLARLNGSISDADREAFERWYADPVRAEAFDRVRARYGVAGLLKNSQPARARSSLPPVRPSRPRAYAMAAAFAVLVVASGVVLLGRPGGLSPARAETLHFETGIGEIRVIPLPDGSRLTLDTGTRVRVDVGPGLRQVTLSDGRARFAVAPDPSRPFIVRAAKLRVTASDSVFDLFLTGDGSTLHLLEGAASVEALGDVEGRPVARLEAGEVILISPGGDRLQSRPAAPSQAVWPTGRLEFADTPLGAAIAEANRYSRVQIGLADPRLSRLRVTGTYQAGDIDGLARSLSAAFGLRLERRDPSAVILHRPDEPKKL